MCVCVWYVFVYVCVYIFVHPLHRWCASRLPPTLQNSATRRNTRPPHAPSSMYAYVHICVYICVCVSVSVCLVCVCVCGCVSVRVNYQFPVRVCSCPLCIINRLCVYVPTHFFRWCASSLPPTPPNLATRRSTRPPHEPSSTKPLPPRRRNRRNPNRPLH